MAGVKNLESPDTETTRKIVMVTIHSSTPQILIEDLHGPGACEEYPGTRQVQSQTSQEMFSNCI